MELAVSGSLYCIQNSISGENLWQRTEVSSIKILIQYTPWNMYWQPHTHTNSHEHTSLKVQCGLSFLYWMFDSLHVRLLSREKSSNGSGSSRKSFFKKKITLTWKNTCFFLSEMRNMTHVISVNLPRKSTWIFECSKQIRSNIHLQKSGTAKYDWNCKIWFKGLIFFYNCFFLSFSK